MGGRDIWVLGIDRYECLILLPFTVAQENSPSLK